MKRLRFLPSKMPTSLCLKSSKVTFKKRIKLSGFYSNEYALAVRRIQKINGSRNRMKSKQTIRQSMSTAFRPCTEV